MFVAAELFQLTSRARISLEHPLHPITLLTVSASTSLLICLASSFTGGGLVAGVASPFVHKSNNREHIYD